MKYDFLIVGAGLSGSILAERIANVLKKKVLLIDKRNHIAGNCYDEKDKAGILIHKYGPHIFHTNDKNVWDYLSAFTNWHHYEHKVLAVIEGKKVPVPFNLNSIEICFSSQKAHELEKLLVDNFGYEAKIPILKLMQNNNPVLKELADYIYKYVFLGYTVKQWGVKPEDLDMSVTARIPVFVSRDNRYFQDKFQGIPVEGYTTLFSKLLQSPNIDIKLNTSYEELDVTDYEKVIYTGPIDSYFNYQFGKLHYRSLRFDFETLNTEQFQETAQVNYPNDYDFTRITEFKHFLDYPEMNRTTIAREFSMDYNVGENEPYYPVPSEKSAEIYRLYKNKAENLKNVYFIGRLADYKYYNMDQVVARALNFFNQFLQNN